ncbi:uncharacterized protein LOC143613520 [Bidens hawaiensis]|uniref:uncharacterized protein LOC143613520 n=1 Tax=Bidens hawaiensis TaxID=980011 RepID=UPI0040494399
MNKQQDYMKLQTCVLKLNTQCACDGCKQKIKKLLSKVDGVYKTSIDLEQGKITVSGNVDPNALVKKLNKSGKHAELWGGQKGGANLINNQFKNMGFDNKNQKGGGGGGGGKDNQKGGKDNQQMQQMLQLQQMQAAMNKGFKDFKPPNKDQKSVKFNLPVAGGDGGKFDDEDDFDDDDDEDDDEFDDEYDDEDDDSLDGIDMKPNNMKGGPGVGGNGPHGPMAAMMNGKKGPGAGFELPFQFKGKGGINDNAKNGNGGKKGGDSYGGKKNKGGKEGGGGGFGGFFGSKMFLGGGKKKQSASSPKGGKKGGDGGKGGNSWDKKGEGKHHDEGKLKGGDKQVEFLDFKKPQNGGGKNMGGNGGGGGGGNGGARNISQMMGGNPMMGQMGNYPMGQMGGNPMLAQQIAYHGQGMDHGNPFSQQQLQQQQQQQQQQQYMQAMMMNQQRANMYPQMMYGHQQPYAAYGPHMGAPGNDNMTHVFSDENTESCSIM